LTWEEVGKIYTELTGVEIRWESEEAFLKEINTEKYRTCCGYYYDRRFDRAVDATAVLEATGLTREELTPIREGLRIELKKLNYL
jgi:hypothetical protein